MSQQARIVSVWMRVLLISIPSCILANCHSCRPVQTSFHFLLNSTSWLNASLQLCAESTNKPKIGLYQSGLHYSQPFAPPPFVLLAFSTLSHGSWSKESDYICESCDTLLSSPHTFWHWLWHRFWWWQFSSVRKKLAYRKWLNLLLFLVANSSIYA